ncbi:MAG: hypothetical protein PHV93_04485 [Candidatus Pacebacteria bacterium]|nr:hypothetical protein [Candidatus Paceibacterota bacterium]
MLYAFALALPKIVFTPWREFQVIIPEKGKPFVPYGIENIVAEETSEIDRLRAIQMLAHSYARIPKLLALHKLTLEELEKAESEALKEFEKNPHSFDEIARCIVDIREMKKQMPIKDIAIEHKRKNDVIVKQDNGTTKGGAKNG